MPGLRVGWIAAPQPVLDRLVLAKYTSCTPELAAEAVRRLRAALEQLPGLVVSQPPSGTPVVV